MRGEEVILLNFPISHFLKSLAHSALAGSCDQKKCFRLRFNNLHKILLHWPERLTGQ